MRIAEILSDLTSLRVCDHAAALAMVNSHESLDGSNQALSGAEQKTQAPVQAASSRPTASRRTSALNSEDDVDLQRALDLVDLHYGVKEKYMGGLEAGLQRARADVEKVLKELEQSGQDAARHRL